MPIPFFFLVENKLKSFRLKGQLSCGLPGTSSWQGLEYLFSIFFLTFRPHPLTISTFSAGSPIKIPPSAWLTLYIYIEYHTLVHIYTIPVKYSTRLPRVIRAVGGIGLELNGQSQVFSRASTMWLVNSCLSVGASGIGHYNL